MRGPNFLSALAVFPLIFAAAVECLAFQDPPGGAVGAGGIFVFVNERAARALTTPKALTRQNVCSGGCRQQRSVAPVQREKNLTAQSRRLLDAANRFYDTGKYTEAADSFRRAARLKPNYEAFIGLGESQYQLKQPNEALKTYQQAVKLNPKLDEAHYNMGVIRYEQKAYADALNSLKTAIDVPPAYTDEYYYYGLTLKELKRTDEAIAALREAIKLDSRYYDAYTELGPLYEGAGRRKEAIEVLRQATRVRPDKSEAFLLLGNALFNDLKYDDAVAAYQEAARLAPDNAIAYNNLADTYYSLIRSADAVKNYEKALALKPDLKKDWGFSVRYGNSLRQVGRVAESMQWFKDALALDPKADSPLYLMGVAFMNSDQPNYPAAIDALNRAAMLNPNRKETFLLLTAAYINSAPRNPTEALQAARRAQQLAPDDPETLMHVGLALGIGQMFEPAYDVFKEVVRLKPDYALARVQLCSMSMVLERYDEGLPHCLRAVELSGPESRNLSRVTMASMYALGKRYDQAIAEANAVIRDDPKSSFAYQSLGTTYMLMKKYDKSVAAFKQAIRLSPELAEAHLQIGAVYAESGNLSEASREYSILLNMNPGYAAQLKAMMDENQNKKKKKK